jgi:hypothetical protein
VGVVQAHGQKVAVFVKDDGEVTGTAVKALLANRIGKQPGMPFADGAFSGRRDMNGDALLGWIW